MEVIDASESQLTLTWVQANPPDYYIIYWKTVNGPEYNVSTPSDDNSYILNDDRLTPATMYYISVTAVTWYKTSDKSNTTYAGTGMSLTYRYRFFAVENHHKSCLSQLFLLHLNTFVMGLWSSNFKNISPLGSTFDVKF